MNETSLSIKNALLTTIMLGLAACSQETPQILVTIADARANKAQHIDLGEPGDSVGDILTFDQPLLNEDMKQVGNNSGKCIRTLVEHSFQCQWTLTFENGSIQVAGREFDQGTSTLSIVGGTGKYSGITGEMESTNNNDGTFTQTLRYWIRR
ncbi:MAG: dirigent protein [Gammaproteobacteria bacterium]